VRKVDLLRQLQDADSRLDSARTLIARLTADLGDRGGLPRREAELASAREELRGLEALQRDLELQAEDRRAKIASDEGKLYSGRVTNPKELGNLSDEVAQDKRQLNAVEDKLLDIIERVEETTKRARALEATLAGETRGWTEAQEAARSKIAETERTVATLDAQRSSATSKLVPSDISTYETLRRQKNGLAVAQVQQRTCQACRVGLTPALEQRARIGADLIPCHSCGRILFVALS
jgi:predicted  nucleic acid-binding Zn-ribbon protein